ncbi:hypothetical protein AbraIFM66950_011918, partial [Aspergillus brasiliensis]
ATLTPLASVGWLGRAWDTHLDTATDTHPDSTGLGWVNGTGLGHLDTRLDTNSHTRLASVGWMGRAWDIDPRLDTNSHTRLASVGWMGWARDNNPPLDTLTHRLPTPTGLGWVDGTGLGHRARHTTQTHTRVWPHGFTDISGPGRVDGSGLGQQHRHTTQTHNGSGLMVGWLGWAWKTHTLYIYSSNTAQRDNTSGPKVGWLGWARVIGNTLTRQYNAARQHFWPWSGGWVGPGSSTHTQQHNTVTTPRVSYVT